MNKSSSTQVAAAKVGSVGTCAGIKKEENGMRIVIHSSIYFYSLSTYIRYFWLLFLVVLVDITSFSCSPYSFPSPSLCFDWLRFGGFASLLDGFDMVVVEKDRISISETFSISSVIESIRFSNSYCSASISSSSFHKVSPLWERQEVNNYRILP